MTKEKTKDLGSAEYLNAKVRVMEAMLEGRRVDPSVLKRFGFKPSPKRARKAQHQG